MLGVNPESTPLVALVIAASAALAAALWWRPNRRILLAVIGFAAIAAVFDTVELAHQINISDSTVATFAGLVAAGHVTIVVLAAVTAIGVARRS